MISLTTTESQTEARWRELTALYREHAPAVYRFLRRRGVDEPELEDVLQDAFTVAWRRLDTLREGASARAWLLGIAFRVASDARRRNARKPRSWEHEPELLADPKHSPAIDAQRRDAAQVVTRFLATLDRERRELFILSQIEGFSAPEIAEITETKLNTVYTRIRACKRLFADYIDALREASP
jgi:RNA polymerase sigma-70 factor, ECF subfamily